MNSLKSQADYRAVMLADQWSLVRKKIQLMSGRDWLLILAAIPVVILLILEPQSFELTWVGSAGQVELGGLLFALFFLGFDLSYLPQRRMKWSRHKQIVVAITVCVAVLCFLELNLGQYGTSLAYSIGRDLGVSCGPNVLPSKCDSASFLTGLDFVSFSFYAAVLAMELFRPRILLRIITPFVFSLGMVIFYMLDAFFPYGQIGPLQFWANYDVEAVAGFAKILGLSIYGLSNNLTIIGRQVSCGLVVFWQSVGVQSVLVFSVVLVSVFFGPGRLETSLNRKIVYAVVGVIGTVALNFLRIFSIAYYGYEFATSCAVVEEFHNIIGDILYPIWIVGFVGLVMKIEDHKSHYRP